MNASDTSSIGRVWLAVGRNLGFTFTSEGSIVEIMLGNRVFSITSDQYMAWSMLHTVEASSPYGAMIGKLAASDAANDPQIAPFLQSLAELTELGLVVSYRPDDPESVEAFIHNYRFIPLQTVAGNTEDVQDSFVLAAGGEFTIIVSRFARAAMLCAQRASNIADLVEAAKPIIADKQLAPETITREVLLSLPEMLRVRAAALDLATPLVTPPGRVSAESVSRRQPLGGLRKLVGSLADTRLTAYAVGYPLGLGFAGSDLKHFVGLGGHEIPFVGGAQQRYCWDAARTGLSTEIGRVFEYFDILEDAQKAGVADPKLEPDSLRLIELVVVPEDDDALIEFAATHQLVPLLDGLSVRDADGNATLGQSVQDEKTMVTITAEEYDAWRVSLTAPTILDAVAAFGMADSARNLDHFLMNMVHGLQAREAAYIDTVPQK